MSQKGAGILDKILSLGRTFSWFKIVAIPKGVSQNSAGLSCLLNYSWIFEEENEIFVVQNWCNPLLGSVSE